MAELGNLDSRRAERARARAAEREGQGEKLPIVFGNKTIAVLDAEFPLFVLAPLREINLDLGQLVQQALKILGEVDEDSTQLANLMFVVEILATNPDLPTEAIDAAQEMGRRLLGEAGYEAFVAERPSPWDVAALIGDLMSWYGVSLGESSPSSDSSISGGTSNTTSGSISVSTPETSGNGQGNPASSVSAA